MNNQDRIKQLHGRFAQDEVAVVEQGGAIVIHVGSDRIHEVCAFLKKNLGYDYLQFLTCIDKADSLDLRYYLHAYAHKASAVVTSQTPRAGGRIKSVSAIWKTADWHEREVYDLFGVVFEGHPNLKRILLEEDFEGHPLLKDFSSKNMVRLPTA